MKKYIYILILSLLLVSCEKELDFKYHDVEPQLVIEAALTSDGARVSLTETTPMSEPINTIKITDAAVSITDLAIGDCRHLVVGDDGVYADATPGEVGHEYRLSVERNGHTYASSCVMRAAVTEPELEFKWIKMPYDHVAVLQVSFPAQGVPDECYWVRLYRNGEPYMWSVVDGSYSIGGTVNDAIMTSRKDPDKEDDATALRDGDVVRACIAPVSRAMFDYLMAIQSDSNGPRMFTGDYCLGYFLAASLAEASIVFRPGEMEEYK